MKTIRYFAMLLAVVSLFVGCSDDDELSSQNKGKTRPTVSVATDAVTDTEFTVMLLASDNAAQFAYAVLKGKDNPAPLAKDIVIKEVSGAIASGAFNVAQTPSQTVTIPCSAATDYQVFAAAITETGLLSEVSLLDVYVPDTGIPSPQTFKASGNSVEVTFSEDIVVGKTGSATVRYVQWGAGQILDAVAIPVENITTSGKVATIVCPKPGNGAGYIVDYTAGMFEDKSGNKCKALASNLNPSTGQYSNLGWDDKNVDIPILDSYFVPQPDDADYNSLKTTIDFVFPFDVIVNTKVKNPVQVIYNERNGVLYLNAEYELQADKRTVKVKLPKVPNGTFDVQVAAGVFYDVWGNLSAAFTVAPDKLRYANIQIEIKEGNYTISYEGGGKDVVNPNSGTPFASRLTKYDDTYYKLEANWFNLMESGYANPVLLGKVDYINQQIVFDGTFLFQNQIYPKPAFGMGFYSLTDGNQLAFWGAGSGGDPIIVQFDEEGYMVSLAYVEYGYHNAEGKYLAPFDIVKDGTMTYVTSDATSVRFNATNASKVYKVLSTPLAGFKK